MTATIVPLTSILPAPTMTPDRRKRISPGVLARVILEQRIVWNLITFLGLNGWQPFAVLHDEEEPTPTPTEMFELLDDLDDGWAVFTKDGREHSVRLVYGNDGIDVISDWQYGKGDTDGFNALMEAFTEESHLERFL